MFEFNSEFSYLIPFFIATFIFGFVPGPSIMYTLAQTAVRGRRGGLNAALGIHLGCFAHIIGAAFGLSAVFTLVPEMYFLIKFAGVGYLLYLGVKMIMAKPDGEINIDKIAKSRESTLLSSAMVEILNPKTAIFYIAFLPQFVDGTAAWPVWLQFLVLGQIINLLFSTADMVYIFMAGFIINKFKKLISSFLIDRKG